MNSRAVTEVVDIFSILWCLVLQQRGLPYVWRLIGSTRAFDGQALFLVARLLFLVCTCPKFQEVSSCFETSSYSQVHLVSLCKIFVPIEIDKYSSNELKTQTGHIFLSFEVFFFFFFSNTRSLHLSYETYTFLACIEYRYTYIYTYIYYIL